MPITDIRDPNTPAPTAADESGRSSQIFVMEATARRRDVERRAIVRGKDIYVVPGPIVVEATHRVVNGLAKRTGVVAAGEVFTAQDFLMSLSPSHSSFEMKR